MTKDRGTPCPWIPPRVQDKEHHVLDVNSHSTFLRYYSFAARIEGWDDLKMPVADDVGFCGRRDSEARHRGQSELGLR